MVNQDIDQELSQPKLSTYWRNLEGICGPPVVDIMAQTSHEQCQHFNVSVMQGKQNTIYKEKQKRKKLCDMFSWKMNSKGETRQAQNARVRNIVMFRFLLEIWL